MSDIEDKPNAELAYRVLDHIDADPASWDQATWIKRTDCGTVACFAGWAVQLAGGEVEVDRWGWSKVELDGEVYTLPGVHSFADIALWALNIEHYYVPGVACPDCGAPGCEDEDHEPPELFDVANTREELGEYVEAIFGPRPASLPFSPPPPVVSPEARA